MMQRCFLFYVTFFVIGFGCLPLKIFTKEVFYEANVRVKQIKFTLRDRLVVFTEKWQSVNNKVTEQWLIDTNEISSQEYQSRFKAAEEEEEQFKREERERKTRELLEKKRRENEAFLLEARIETLKKLVGFELENVERMFGELDRYKLEAFFVFEEDSFQSPESFQEIKIGLISKARELIIRKISDLDESELAEVLHKLEDAPVRIERLQRKSVKFAINHCNDTERLKELLKIIS